MEFFKRSWAQTRDAAGQLTPNARVMIAMSVVILLLFGFVLMQYVARPSMVPITGIASARHDEVLPRLKGMGIRAQASGGQILVPVDQREDAIAALATTELMAPDAASAFDDLIRNQSPWTNHAQNERAFLLAKRKALAQIVARINGVHSADVMLDQPEHRGFGRSYVRPSASVNVVMERGRAVDNRLVEAIAGLVSGAVAEMKPEDVEVIDANRGRRLTVGDGDMAPTDALELVRAIEREYEKKINDVLSYIRGVRVAVAVRTDPVQRRDIVTTKYEPNEPLRSQMSRDQERRTIADTGEPGVRSNTGASIAGGRSSGTTETTSESRTEYAPKNITETSQVRERGQGPKQVNVTVNVPRSYFVQLMMSVQTGDAAATPPPADQIEAFAQRELPRIESQVQPLISAVDAGMVRAHMIPDLFSLPEGVGDPVGVATLVQGPWAKPIGLLALAALCIGLMLALTRRAMRDPMLPSIEELAGLPPELAGSEELMGEVDGDEAAIAGREVSDEEVRSRRIAEQISELIRSNPVEAAGLFARWADNQD